MAYLSVPKISRHLIFLHLSSPFIVDNCSYISILSFAITYSCYYSASISTIPHFLINLDCSNLFYAHLLALRTRSIPRSKELGQFRFFHVKKDVPFGVIGHSREFPITREIALSSQFTHYANCNPISHNLIISQLYYLRLSIYSQILSSNRQNGQRLPIH